MSKLHFWPRSNSAQKWTKPASHLPYFAARHVLGEMRQREMRVLDVCTMHSAPTSIDEPLLPLSRYVKPESALHPSVVDAQLPHPLPCLSPRSSPAVCRGQEAELQGQAV